MGRIKEELIEILESLEDMKKKGRYDEFLSLLYPKNLDMLPPPLRQVDFSQDNQLGGLICIENMIVNFIKPQDVLDLGERSEKNKAVSLILGYMLVETNDSLRFRKKLFFSYLGISHDAVFKELRTFLSLQKPYFKNVVDGVEYDNLSFYLSYLAMKVVYKELYRQPRCIKVDDLTNLIVKRYLEEMSNYPRNVWRVSGNLRCKRLLTKINMIVINCLDNVGLAGNLY